MKYAAPTRPAEDGTEGRLTWLRATPPHIELARDRILGDLSEEQLEALAALLEPIGGRLDQA